MREPVQELIGLYQNNIYAAAFSICKNAQDAEDVVQETFIQYHMSKNQFESQQHIRAWLIRVAINKAKNVNHTFWRKNKVPLEEYMETLAFETPKSQNLFETVMKLPEKYRTAIHLFYYEELSIGEIAAVTNAKASTVRTRLTRARRQLGKILKKEEI